MSNLTHSFAVAALLLSGIPALAQSEAGSVLWTYDAGIPIVSSPALAGDGTVYLATMTGLYAVTNAGSVASNKWAFPLEISSSSPAVAPDGTIYFSGRNGNLYAIAPDGSQRWSYAAQSGGTSPALGFDGTIYIQGDSGFSAVSPSGIQKWRVLPGDSGSAATPAIGQDGTIYIGSSLATKLYAYSPDGISKWAAELPSGPGGPPAIGDNGTIYVSGQIFKAFAPDGTPLWSLNIAAPLSGPSVVSPAGAIYVCGPDRSLYAITADGQVSWNAIAAYPRFGHTAPAVDSAGTIYYCISNAVWALNPQGQVQWVVANQAPAPNIDGATSSPTLGPDGKLYAGIGTKLYAIAVTNPPPQRAWPMYQQNWRHTGKVEKPSLQKPKKRSDANFQFELYAQVDQPYTIEASTNLNTWTSLTSFVATALPTQVFDLDATNFPARFYRAVSGSPAPSR